MALEASIRRTRLRLGIALCTAAAVATSCGSAEPTTTSTLAPTTTATVAATTTTTTLPSSTTAAVRSPERTLPVPDNAAPTIDGVIAAGEWDGATETTMTDGGTLLWMRSNETLYVALQGHSLGAVNLAIAARGELWILHSSAALGSVSYVEAGEDWTLVHDFEWCCRGANNTATRLALLENEGWQANIGFAGDRGTVEYEVTLPWNGAAVAVSYQTEETDPAFWPADLTTEATVDLIGPFPNERQFHLDEWYHLASADS